VGGCHSSAGVVRLVQMLLHLLRVLLLLLLLRRMRLVLRLLLLQLRRMLVMQAVAVDGAVGIQGPNAAVAVSGVVVRMGRNVSGNIEY